ncbi:MAG: extracellular solute-binding protein [Rhodospirillales bacterium]|jgi:microcin C transport system substrate-binding protein|nr:extracellular solute-binding protein [Rhodospirillales bacterium]MDP6884117.1 extracellular solute-binding protein [Rhodospirillales bacterium]
MGWSVLRVAVPAILAVIVGAPDAEAQQRTTVAHAIAMHGQPKYGPDFKHFDYVDPKAPKGGRVRLGVRGTFDTFNRFIPKGVAGAGDATETLLTSSADEPFTEYGLIAESIEWPEDRSWVIFTLRPEARWHDGKAITVEDVIFSLDILKTKGRPFFRFYYASIKKAEKVGPRKVKFTFAEAGNRELPLIAGQIPILPKHYWEKDGRDFTKTTLEPPLGSGPYRVADFEAGRYVVVERVKDYWGAHLPVKRGRSNFDTIRYEYYFDETVLRQALKADKLDYREENQAKAWALDYDTPAVRDGRLKLEKIGHKKPTGMQAFIMNTRRQVFKNRKLRRALAYAFDFEWSNRNLFFSQYTRTESYFSNSELAATDLPQGEELKVLERYRGRVPDEVFTQVYRAPKTDGSGWPRDNLSRAFALLAEAGWVVRDMKMVNAETGQQLKFEILLYSTAFERIVLPFKRNLTRLGIDARVRLVDTSQYINRLREFDFDMIVASWGQSESPGNEQRSFWSSEAAAAPGARNLIGIKDPVVDALIELVISAPSRQSLVNRTRALDRVLLWGHYVIPNWHVRVDRVASWNKFSRPAITPRHGNSLDYWWLDAAKDAALKARQVVQSTDEEAAGGDAPGAGTAIAVFLGLMVVGFVVVRRALGRRSG